MIVLGTKSSEVDRSNPRPLAWNGSLITLLGIGMAVLVGLVLIQLPPLQGMALVGLLAVVIGALIEPLVGLGAALFLGPLKAYLSAEVPQIPAQVGHAFVALALASWLVRGLARRDLRIAHSPLLLPVLGFLGAVLLSLWDAVGLVAYGVPELIKWGEILLVYVFITDHLGTDAAPLSSGLPSTTECNRAIRRWQWLMAVLLVNGVFQALIGIWQFGLRGEGPEHFRIPGGDFFRAYGTFEQPNPYAGYLALTAALAMGTVVGTAWDRLAGNGAASGRRDDSGPRRRPVAHRCPDRSVSPLDGWSFYLLGGGATLTILVALVASWSRGAWVGFAAAGLVMAAALPRKTFWSLLLVAMLVIGGAGLYVSGWIPPSFAARLTSFVQDIRLEDVRGVPINDANYAVVERLAHWQAAVSMFQHNLWTGVGFGCYEAAYSMFALINWPIALGHAHNIYLNLLAETGLIGLVAYLILWGVVLWKTWRVTRCARGPTRGLAIGLLGACIHISVHHLLDNLYVNNVHLHVAVLLGLAAIVIRETNQMSSIDDY